MSEKKFTVSEKRRQALPRSKRLRALGVGGVSASVGGDGGGTHNHPNKDFLDTLGDDETAEDGAKATRRIWLDRTGAAYIEYNASTGCMVCNVPIASRGDVSAFADGGGESGGESGGGQSYQRLDAWSDYDAAKAGYVLSALLGVDLNGRVAANAADIAEVTAAMAALASRTWVNGALGDYLRRQPVLSEASDVCFVLSVGGIDGTYQVQGVDLTSHSVPSAVEATHAASADTATTAGSATTAARAVEADVAKKMSTARTIYGQAYDGTSAVDGRLVLTGANDGAGLWGTSVDMRVSCSVSAGTLWTAGTKSWGQSTFKDGKVYWWTQDGETQEFVASYTPEGKTMLMNCALRVNGGLTLPADVRVYLSHNKNVWLYYDSARDVIVANKPIVTAGDVTAFDTVSE